MTVASIDPTKVIDHYDLDDGDATHPIYIDYVVPAAAKGIIKVTLSWKLRAFRSTVNLNPGTIGTDASGSSGHSHNHAHTIPITGAVFANAIGWDGVGQNFKGTGGGNTGAINADATGESGHSHSHTHSLSGSGVQSVTDGVIGTVAGLLIDNKDLTAGLGGPWGGDVVELDLSSVFPSTASIWHTIALNLSGLGRVVSLLRLYYTS